MINAIYLKFSWDTIFKREQWLTDFPLLKEKILEQVYLPTGWDVGVGKVDKQITLTLMDEQTIYYMLYGTFDESEQCFIVDEIDYIFLPNNLAYTVITLVFVASSSEYSSVNWQRIQKYIQQPINAQLVTKQHASSKKNEFLKQLKPLNISGKIKKYDSNRYLLEVLEFRADLISNHSDNYVLYRQEGEENISIPSIQAHATEIGLLESCNEEKNQLIFTCQNANLIPTKKDVKQCKFFLVSSSLYRQLLVLQETTNSLMIQSSKNKIDYRYVVKKSVKELFEEFHLQLMWSSSLQLFYYSNETVKQQFLQDLLHCLIESKHPITAIVEPQTALFLKGKGKIEKAVDFDKLKSTIQSYIDIQQQVEKNEEILQSTREEIEKLTTEINQLQFELVTLENERKDQYETVHKEKEQFRKLLQQKEIMESQLMEFEDTKKYLRISNDELKEHLKLNRDQEKRSKKSLENVYLQLNEFKQSEKNYLEIFQQIEKSKSAKTSLKKLEARLLQYKQLGRNVDQCIATVTDFFGASFEEQCKKLNDIVTIDLTHKITDQVEEMKNVLPQLKEQLNGLDGNTTDIQELNNNYNEILTQFAQLNIAKSEAYVHPINFTKQDIEMFTQELHKLLAHQPPRIIGIFGNRQKDWQAQVSYYFDKFMAGYTYWRELAFKADVQKQALNKQAQVKMYRYCMKMKNGLQSRKHEEVHQFIRKTEIELSEVYLELFMLNRYQEEGRRNLKFFDASLDAHSFKDKKSSMQLKLTELISTIQDMTKTIETIQLDLEDYRGKLSELEAVCKQHGEELTVTNTKYEQAKRQYERLFGQYKMIQEQSTVKLNVFEAKNSQLAQLENDEKKLVGSQLQYQEVINLPVLQTFYEKRNEVEPGVKWLNVMAADNVTAVSGITIIENIQQLSPLALKQIAQQADYIIGFTSVKTDRLFGATLQMIESKKLLPIILESQQFYDECVVGVLEHFFSTKFTVKKKLHYLSTSHIRNNHYITWIKLESQDVMHIFETILSELHENKKILHENNISERKVRVKLFSDDGSVLKHIHKNLKGYSLRYHYLKLLKQHDGNVDLHLVHFSDTAGELREKLNLFKELLLTNKPIVIISSAGYLEQRELEPILDTLSRFQRIKESSREKRWATSIKLKE